MKHNEFSIHRLFLYKGDEYICTDIGTRTIVAVLFSSVREDWWLASTPYPGAMFEGVFDENLMPACEPMDGPGQPSPKRTPIEKPPEKSTPPPAPAPISLLAFPLPPLRFLILATVFYVLGIGALIYCASTTLHTRAFLTRAARAVATVTSVEESVGQKNSRRYTPTFVFTDGQGKTWTNDSGQTEDSPRRIGEEVTILYDPKNPAEARIESFENTWGTPIASGLTGLLMLGAGAAVGSHFSGQLRKMKANIR